MPCSRVWRKVREGFSSLRGSPRDLYLLFALKVLESFGYFSTSLLYTLYLTEQFGMSDDAAGVSYGIWGSLIMGYNVVFAPLIDGMGVKTSLRWSFLLTAVGRLGMAMTHSKTFLMFLLYGPLPMGTALGVPVMVIGVKKCTTCGSRGFAFGLFYSMMNVAALVNGAVFDIFRIRLKNGLQIEGLGTNSIFNDGMRLLVLLCSATSATALLITTFLTEAAHSREDLPSRNYPNHDLKESVDERASMEDGQTNRHSSASSWSSRSSIASSPSRPTTVNWQNTLGEIWELIRCRPVQKFLAVCLLTVNLKMIFRHLDATLPKYQIRAFGCNAHVGLLYSINPFMIIWMVPLVGALTTSMNHFDMIHWGSYWTALSPFWMVAFQAEWAVALFVLTLSFGEAIWSPRWYDYSMSVAPNGKEGIFTALSAAPLFLAKLPTGALSGRLLSMYCPDNGKCSKEENANMNTVHDGTHCQGQMLWLVIGILVLVSPLGMLIFQQWLRPSLSDEKQLEKFTATLNKDQESRERLMGYSEVQYQRIPRDVEIIRH